MAPAAGPKDQQTQKAAGLDTKLPVLWQWTGPYFEHCPCVSLLILAPELGGTVPLKSHLQKVALCDQDMMCT